MKNILFYESRPEWGGAQKCELELLLHLEEHGFRTFFLSSTDGPMLERIRRSGKALSMIPISEKVDRIRKEQANFGGLYAFYLFFFMISHYWRVASYLRRQRVDIVYTSQFRSQLIIAWLAKLLRKKVVWHIHGEESLQTVLGKLAVLFSDRIIVVSEQICRRYRELFPRQKDKFCTVYNGISFDFLWDDSKKAGTVTLAMVGTLVEGKRQDLAIEACARLKELGYAVHLYIIGEKPPWQSDEYKTQLKRLVAAYRLSEEVSFLGWVEQPQQILRRSHIFLLPSDTEGMPLSVLEAMAAGLPCVATDVGGISELIEHGQTGFVVRRGDVTGLVDALRRLVGDEHLRLQMGRKAEERYKQLFTKEMFLKGVARVLRSL